MPELRPTGGGEGVTHEELVGRAVAWLRARGCGVVLAECTSSARETPDAIGWKSGRSILVEVKVSRGDFHREKHKASRRPELHEGRAVGMGGSRFYMTPPGLLDPCELEACGWGLLEAGRVVRVVRASRGFDADLAEEVRLLTSELRILHLAQSGAEVLRTGRAERLLAGFPGVRWRESPTLPPRPSPGPGPVNLEPTE